MDGWRDGRTDHGRTDLKVEGWSRLPICLLIYRVGVEVIRDWCSSDGTRREPVEETSNTRRHEEQRP